MDITIIDALVKELAQKYKKRGENAYLAICAIAGVIEYVYGDSAYQKHRKHINEVVSGVWVGA